MLVALMVPLKCSYDVMDGDVLVHVGNVGREKMKDYIKGQKRETRDNEALKGRRAG